MGNLVGYDKKEIKTVRQEFSDGLIITIAEKDLINSLAFDTLEETTGTEIYRGFKLTLKGLVHDVKKPFIVKHYNGYIKYIGDDDENYELEHVDKVLECDEVVTLVHYGWTGGCEDGSIGFDCAHSGDLFMGINIGKVNEINIDFLRKVLLLNDPLKIYSFDPIGIETDESTFKTREYVFAELRKIADKSLEILGDNNILNDILSRPKEEFY